jgi:GNAT superfamily N-acetyltransferase
MTEIHALKEDEFPFLQEMAVQAMWWQQSSSELPSIAQALTEPAFAKLLDGWGRPGDRALIATGSDERLGAVWFRLWDPDHHSYGFVDSQTPELGIAVLPASRRQGIGRALLRRLVDLARADGHRSLSLSVNPANPARLLYESEGFVRVDEDAGGSWTMLADLDATHE